MHKILVATLCLLTGVTLAATKDEPSSIPSQPCATFKKLPMTTFSKDTVVEDDCLEVPPSTKIRVEQGVHLIIIARKQLQLGNSATLDAMGGTPTQKGPDAPITETVWKPSGGDEGEQVACVCRGTHCRPGWGGPCRASEDPGLRGRKGLPGLAGGDVRIVARELIVGNGVVVNISGGSGGPPGNSGRTRCENPGDKNDFCYSGSAPNEGAGDQGMKGRARFEAGTATADATLTKMVDGTLPKDAASKRVIDTPPSLTAAIQNARTEGAKYDHRQGI